MKFRLKKSIMFLMLLLMCLPAMAGDQPDSLFTEFKENFKKEYFSVGALFQAVTDFQIERSFSGNNGFNISNMRINFSGIFDGGFGYFFQGNLIDSPSILSADMFYETSPAFRLTVGLFKAPFSKEFLTSAANIDFVNRSQIVTYFAPRWQIGVQASGWFRNSSLYYAGGLFNGNGFDGNNNDNNNFMAVGRIAYYPRKINQSADKHLEAGFNFAHSKDDNLDLGSGLYPHFFGKRTLVGADFRYIMDRWLFAGEIISASLEPGLGREISPYGFYLTVGDMLSAKSQILFRWDSFHSDGLLYPDQDSDLLILGYNYWPTRVTELQVNYIIRTQDMEFEHSQILVNAQVAF
ncbi:MAG: porin [Calditrichia bacterium]